jgi:5-formyltetrahydrofolate cyclo-ligase
MEISKAKQALRKDMACRKKEYSSTWLSARSLEALIRLEGLDLFKQAKSISLYHALPGEVETSAFIEKWEETKTIFLPLVEGNDLYFHTYKGKHYLQRGAFGIMEPERENSCSTEQIDLIIVPGIAFDRQCNRMGRGKGYYDRLLTTLPIPKIGLCYHFQLVDKIPTEPFDIPVDMVVTDKESILSWKK